MKTAIFTVRIPKGLNQYNPCMLSMSKYAERIGADYYVTTDPSIRFYSVHFEKFQFVNLFEQGYDRVLVVDADVMATPNARNIFEEYPKSEYLYALDESLYTDTSELVNPLARQFNRMWPENSKGSPIFINGGVVLYSMKTIAPLDQIGSYNEIEDIFKSGNEKSYLNYVMVTHDTPVLNIDKKFNWMDFGNGDPENDRYNADFIHYSGMCEFGDQDKYSTIISDYNHLYGEPE